MKTGGSVLLGSTPGSTIGGLPADGAGSASFTSGLLRFESWFFGCSMTIGAGGALRAVPQLGGVVIEDDVAIGPLSTIDAGTLGPTRIRRGAKLDAHVHVGHNVLVGISCPATSFCAAADQAGNVLMSNASAWGPPVHVAQAASAISCTSSTFCVLVDGSGDAAVYRNGTWLAPVDIDGGDGDVHACRFDRSDERFSSARSQRNARFIRLQ